MASLPTAQEMRDNIDRNKLQKQQSNSAAIAVMTELGNNYEEFLRSLINERIQKMFEGTNLFGQISLNFHDEISNIEKTCKIHQLHYGRQKSRWNDREACFPEEEIPFRKIQKEFFDLGYFVLDESDGSKSFKSHIMIYAAKPVNYGVNTLWHGLNVLPSTIAI